MTSNAPSAPLSHSAAEALVARVVRAAGVSAEPEAIAAAAARIAAIDDPNARRAEVCEVLASLGLTVRPIDATVGKAASLVGPEHPVLALHEGGWVLLVDRRGAQLCIETDADGPRWVRRGAVAATLDPRALAAIEWLAIEPRELFFSRPRHDPSTPPSAFARLRALMRTEKHDIWILVAYAVGIGLLTLVAPVAVQALVGTVAFGTLLQPLVVLAILLLAGLAISAVLRGLSAWVIEMLQRRLFVRLVASAADRLPRARLERIDEGDLPALVYRYFDLFTVQKAAASLLTSGLEVVLAGLTGLVVLAFYHPLLLAFDVFLIGTVIVVFFVFGRGATKTAIVESKAKYRTAEWLGEIARAPLAFASAHGAELARDRADRLALAYLEARNAHFRVVFRQLAGALALQALASAGVLGLGGWLVIERQLTLGQLVAAELIVTVVVASFAKLAKELETGYDLLAALDKVGQLADLPTEPAHGDLTMASPDPKGSRIAAHALTVATADGAPVVEKLDLAIAPGERIALRGSSGHGRGRLAQVLSGLRLGDGGRLEIDGDEIRDLRISDLRSRVAYVREAALVSGSIEQNVSFGRPLDARAIRSALAAVDLLDEVARHPKGLATPVTPSGAPLSRGQALRVTIARAIAGQPSLLVIDRALDGLDPQTRERVLTQLVRPEASWTLIVATDDPQVAARCHRTVDLDARS